MIQRVGEMLAFQSYNVKSPLNGRAAQWVEEHLAQLPLEKAEFFLDLSAAPAEEAPATGCANCGATGAPLSPCGSGHTLCAAACQDILRFRFSFSTTRGCPGQPDLPSRHPHGQILAGFRPRAVDLQPSPRPFRSRDGRPHHRAPARRVAGHYGVLASSGLAPGVHGGGRKRRALRRVARQGRMTLEAEPAPSRGAPLCRRSARLCPPPCPPPCPPSATTAHDASRPRTRCRLDFSRNPLAGRAIACNQVQGSGAPDEVRTHDTQLGKLSAAGRKSSPGAGLALLRMTLVTETAQSGSDR